jgi:hypothetical protein
VYRVIVRVGELPGPRRLRRGPCLSCGTTIPGGRLSEGCHLCYKLLCRVGMCAVVRLLYRKSIDPCAGAHDGSGVFDCRSLRTTTSSRLQPFTQRLRNLSVLPVPAQAAYFPRAIDVRRMPSRGRG